MASDKDSNISKFPEKNSPRKTGSSRKGLYIFSVAILVIVVVTFIGGPLVGGVGGQQAGGRLIFGYYDGTPIEYRPGNYFARQLQMLEQQASESEAQEDPQMQMYQIWRGAYDRTLFHTAVVHRAKQSSIPINPEQIDRAIAQNPQFQENDRFSSRLYERLSSQQQYELRELTEEDLLHDRYLRDVLSYNLTAAAESDFFASMASPQRRVEYVSFPFDTYPDSALRAYMEEEPELFQSVEASTITLQKENYSLEEAEDIYNQIVGEESSFEEAARNYSGDMFAELGGDAGEIYFYDILPDFPSEEPVRELFSTPQDEVSPLVEANSAYVLYKINRSAQSPDPENDELLSEVRSYLLNYERGVIADYFQNVAEEFTQAARDNGFQEAAAEMEIEAYDTEFFAINYGNLPYFASVERNTELGNVHTNRSFFTQAFGTPLNAVAEPVSLQNRIVVINPVEERDAEEQTNEMLASFYPNFVQQTAGRTLENDLLNSDLIEDQFMETLFTQVMNTGN